MRLSFGTLFVFSLPIFGVEFIIYPALFILPTFYASRTTGNLAAFATAILLSRIIYAWSGPIIGYLSDRFPTRWGRRKPWMVGGMLLAIVGVLLLFFPPSGAGVAYFGWASALALFAFSIIDIPYVAWGSEITRDDVDRTRIASFRMWFAIASIVVFLLLPYVPGFGGQDLLNPVTIQRLGVAAMVVVAVSVGIGVWWGPPAIATIAATPSTGETLRMLRTLVTNRPLGTLFAATFLTYMAIGVTGALQLAFLSSYGVTALFGIVITVGYCVTLAMMPVWTWIAARIGKRRSWIAGLLVTVCAPAAFYAVLPFFGPGAAAVASGVVSGIAPVILFMPYSALGDVIDLDELRSRTNHAAILSALLLVVIRLTATLGGALAFYVLAGIGYSLHGSNTAAATLTMHATYFALPVLLSLLAIPCIWAYPLDERRSGIVRRRLSQRRAQA